MPWKGMVIEERTGGTMVKIPKFWYKLSYANGSTGLKIQIANRPLEGFVTSPAHIDRGDGKGERDFIYIGRYLSSSVDYKSKSNSNPASYVKSSEITDNLHTIGEDIWTMDFLTLFTIWLLYLVEFADWDSQAAIGYGCGSGSTGYTDSMDYHTGTSMSNRTTYGLGTQYRNIEGLWDNRYCWIGGYNIRNSNTRIVIKPTNFMNGNAANLSINNWNSGIPISYNVINSLAYNLIVFSPSQTGISGKEKTGDQWGYVGNKGAQFAYCGNSGISKSQDYGMFYIAVTDPEISNRYIGCRIIELP